MPGYIRLTRPEGGLPLIADKDGRMMLSGGEMGGHLEEFMSRVWAVEPVGDGFALKAMINNRYLSRGAGNTLRANGNSPGSAQIFNQVIAHYSWGELKASSGESLCIPWKSEGEELAALMAPFDGRSRFVIDDVTHYVERTLNMDCCCGGSHAEGKWEIPTHQQVVAEAVQLLRHHRKSFPKVERFLELWGDDTKPSQTAFRRSVMNGLHDADTVKEYMGVGYGEASTYHKHFYDIDAKGSWLSTCSNIAINALGKANPETARSEFLKWFAQSSKEFSEKGAKPESVGHKLGLTLHYLTDLTQPLHAANFPCLYGDGEFHVGDWRHQQFERFAEKMVADGEVPVAAEKTSASDIDPAKLGYRKPEELIDAVARKSKDLFTSVLKPEIKTSTAVNAVETVLDYVSPFAFLGARVAGSLAVNAARRWLDYKPGEKSRATVMTAVPFARKMTAATILIWLG